MEQQADDAALVAALKAGGSRRETAVGQLYAELGQRLRGFFSGKGLDVPAAEDLLHETFVKLLRGIDGFRGESPLRAWLWTIARNELGMYWRAAARREDGTEPEVLARLLTGDDQRALETEALVACVRDALRQFEARHREHARALRLVVQHEWGIAEVAAHLGRTRGATREFLSQARKRLVPFVESCRALLPEAGA